MIQTIVTQVGTRHALALAPLAFLPARQRQGGRDTSGAGGAAGLKDYFGLPAFSPDVRGFKVLLPRYAAGERPEGPFG
jgi:hypothetical protein